MSLTSVITLMDKFADKEVSNFQTLVTWIKEFQAAAAGLAPSLGEVQIEAALGALLPLVNLIATDILQPVATTLDAAVKAFPVTPVQAASTIVAVANALATAAPAVSTAAAAVSEAVKDGGH
jgi:hypothetical protein